MERAPKMNLLVLLVLALLSKEASPKPAKDALNGGNIVGKNFLLSI